MRSTTLLLACVALLALLAMVDAEDAHSDIGGRRSVRYDGHTVLRVDDVSLSRQQKHALKHITDQTEFKLDRWSASDLMVSPSARAGVESYLRAHGLDWSVMVADVGAEIFREDVARVSHRTRMGTEDVLAYEQGAADFFADYHSLSDIDAFCANLASQYPELVSSKVIGHSYSGHPLTVYIVTSRKNLGAATKPAIYLESGIHAREWISHATNTYMFNAFVTGYGYDTHITSLLDNLEYHFLPVVNPDGYLYTWTTDRMWRKTTKPNPGSRCMGTDPNRNWDNHWCSAAAGGTTDPCSESFCGSAPFSEVEVKAVAEYASSTSNIVAFVDFHSYSQLWMQPYGYTARLPANNDAQSEMGRTAVAALSAINGVKYKVGPIYTTIYPASGSSADWAYDNTTHIKFAYGVELRDTGRQGFLLSADQIVPSGIETLAAVVAMGDYIIKNPQHLQADQPEIVHFGNMKHFARRGAAQAAAPAGLTQVQEEFEQLELELLSKQPPTAAVPTPSLFKKLRA